MFPREAAACGLPVIATNYSGLAVHLDQWAYALDDWELVPAPGESDGLPGLWANPSIDEVAERMRWCYEHQDEARQKGQQGAAWLRANQTWKQSIDTLYEVFQGQTRANEQRRQSVAAQDAQQGGFSIQQFKQLRDEQHLQIKDKVSENGLR